jgi:NAD(P)-dependent dehydrogenase (short-subunit alcohol dehydrogenase family)
MPKTILLIGANRGLGLGLTNEYLTRGWNVIATARNPAHAEALTALKSNHAGQLRIEPFDVTDPKAAGTLTKSLSGIPIDVLFVVAGQSKATDSPIHDVAPEIAAQEFLTNSVAPPTVAEALLPVLAPHAPIVFMTSLLGSLANSRGGMELYRASKAALNMLAIGFAARHPDRRVLLMHPGWVKTDMGGENAPLDIPTSVRGMADVIETQGAGTGIAYVDYAGNPIAW